MSQSVEGHWPGSFVPLFAKPYYQDHPYYFDITLGLLFFQFSKIAMLNNVMT